MCLQLDGWDDDANVLGSDKQEALQAAVGEDEPANYAEQGGTTSCRASSSGTTCTPEGVCWVHRCWKLELAAPMFVQMAEGFQLLR